MAAKVFLSLTVVVSYLQNIVPYMQTAYLQVYKMDQVEMWEGLF